MLMSALYVISGNEVVPYGNVLGCLESLRLAILIKCVFMLFIIIYTEPFIYYNKIVYVISQTVYT